MQDETIEDTRARSASRRQGPGADKGQGTRPRLLGASAVIGNDVFNDNDEDLGDIREVMLDVHTGQVSYAVLSFGGFLGMGEKLFAVPWAALELENTNRSFVLRVSKARLESAPGFDKHHWPDMADPEWEKAVHAFYGTKPQSDATP